MLDGVYAANERLTDAYADKLHVNYDLDRTLVSFQGNKRENGHRWCKYKEGFSAALMRYIFDRLELKSGKLLDPFAGSGTALFTASDYGLDAVGIELLPHCAEIIKTRNVLHTVAPMLWLHLFVNLQSRNLGSSLAGENHLHIFG